MKYACQINQTLILYKLKANLTWKGTLQELVGQSGIGGLAKLVFDQSHKPITFSPFLLHV